MLGVGEGQLTRFKDAAAASLLKALVFLLSTSVALRPFKKACSEHTPCNKANSAGASSAFTIQ